MFNYILYRIGQFIALSLPLKVAYRVAIFISDLRYLFAREDRLNVTANLKVILPEESDAQIRLIRIRVFRNFAKYLVDFFRFSRIDRKYIKNNIHLENMHYIDEALSKGKGAITLTAHLGNWELGGVVIALLGYQFWAVVLPHKQKPVDNFFNFQRQSKGVHVVSLPRAVRQGLSVLKENKVLALVGDRDFSQRGMIVNFFGRPAFFPEGPAAFALKTGATIVPGFMLRNNDNTFTLRMEKPLEFSATGDKDRDLRALIERYKAIIEGYIRNYPDQWYMFRKFWAENGINANLRNHSGV